MENELIDIARLAAYIDGEGYIGILKAKNSASYYGYRYVPRVQVTNTNYTLIDWLSFMFDFKIFEHHSPDASRRTCYHAELANQKAVDIAEKILPFLIIKPKQAELLIKFWESTRWSKGSIVPTEIMKERERIHLLIKELNR
jgi:hypothetical protein